MASPAVRSSVRGVSDLSRISPVLLDLAGLSPERTGRGDSMDGSASFKTDREVTGRSGGFGGAGM